MIFSESNANISAALVKAWGEIQNPKHNANVKVKTKTGSEYTFDYTDLGGIMDEAKRVFKDNGISIIQNAYTIESNAAVQTMLLHSSGEWIKSEPLKMQASHAIQDMGGQITYMKRYSLSAMLGISTEKDDDGNGASGNEYQYKKQSEPKSTPITITPTVKAKYQAVYGGLDGIEEYVSKHGKDAEKHLTYELQNKNKGA